MNKSERLLLSIAFAAVCVVLSGFALAPASEAPHFVVTNDGNLPGNNTGTIMTLINSSSPPSLIDPVTLHTDEKAQSISALQMIALAKKDQDVCIFLANPHSAVISSFAYPSGTFVANYKLPGVPHAFGTALAARAGYFYAGYSYTDYSHGFKTVSYIAVTRIGTGCMLHPVSQTAIRDQPAGMAVSLDDKKLVLSYFDLESTVDSFFIGADQRLTEKGPYGGGFFAAEGVDITADSKYAIIGEDGFGEMGSYTEVGIWVINPDGSLGEDYDYGGTGELGKGVDSGYVWLSPDEKFLFVTDVAAGTQEVTTLDFNESVPSVSYHGCIIRPKSGYPRGLETVLPSGSGTYLYLYEATDTEGESVGLYGINSATGCLSELPGSPYLTGHMGNGQSVAAWPPRPF